MNVRKLGHPKFRMMCQALDDANMVVNINRISSKRFELHINFQVVKCYRQRRSCNMYIKKLYHQHLTKKTLSK